MDECMPAIPRIVNIFIKTEYFHEYIVGEHVDRHQAYMEQSAFVQAIVQTAYVDLVLDQMGSHSKSTSRGCRAITTGPSQ
jgi:hypothetical protein